MEIKDITVPGYEKVVEAEIAPGVTSIIAVHNTKRGPALGGCRFYNYVSKEEGLTDVLRLSEGMSYKSAMADLPLGGGKSIIMGSPQKDKTPELLANFGHFVESLQGLYITAKDVGIKVKDLDDIAQHTSHVRGTSQNSGDPSPVTAFGVYRGMKAAAQFRWSNNSLQNRKIIIQGLGHVGYEIARLVREEGADVLACDIDTATLQKAQSELSITPIGLDDWMSTPADIFCPCAMGAILNKKTIPQLKGNGIQIVAGGANNQLLDVIKDGALMKESQMVYAPDYIINSGGVINITFEGQENAAQKAMEKTSLIYDTTLAILERAQKEDKPTATVSLEMAREVLGLS